MFNFLFKKNKSPLSDSLNELKQINKEEVENLKQIQQLSKQLLKQEEEIQNYYKRLNFENKILKLISKGESSDIILKTITSSVSELLDNAIGSILLLKSDNKLYNKCVEFLPTEYSNLFNNGFPIGPNNGACGAAAFFKQNYSVNSIADHPNWNIYPDVQEIALKNGLLSCYSSPIINTKSEVLGTVAIYGLSFDINIKILQEVLCWSSKISAIVLERDKTLEDLHQSSEFLKGIFESQNDLFVFADLNGKIKFANKSYKKTFGTSDGDDLKLLIHEDDLEDSKKCWEIIKNPPYKIRHEQRAKTDNGNYSWFEWEAWTLFDKNNNPIGICGNGRNIDGRKFSEENLEITNSRLLNILNSQTDCIARITVDDGLIVYCNDKYHNTFIQHSIVCENKYIFEDIFPNHMQKFKNIFFNSNYELECLMNVNGEYKWFHIQSGLVKDAYSRYSEIQLVMRDIHKHKLMEESLQKNELFLSNVFDSIKDGLHVLDKDLNVIKVNKTIIDWNTGLLEEDILGKKCYNVYYGLDNPCNDCVTLKALQTGNKEYKLRNFKDRWLEVFAYPLKNFKTNEIDGVIEFIRDITDKKELENKLILSEERFQLLSKNIPSCIYLCNNDSNWSMQYLNDYVYTLTGYTKKEFLENKISFPELYEKDFSEKIYADVDYAIKNNIPFHLIYKIKDKNNNIKWIEEFGDCIKDENGEVKYLAGVINDITEKKKLLDNYDTLLNNIDILIWFINDPEIQGPCNDKFLEFFGIHNSKDIIGKRLDELIPYDDAKFCIDNNRKVFEDKTTICSEEWVTDKHGDLRLLYITKKPKIVDGKVQYVVCYGIDITDKKMIENELDKSIQSNIRKSQLLEAIIDASGGFIWFKDQNGKYIFCESTFMKLFFDINDKEYVLGKTDIELLNEYRNNTNRKHEFGELCVGTDDHSRDKGYQCRYIEGGHIDGRLFILEVIKTPIYDENNNYIGNIGFAWDRSDELEYVFRDLENLKKENRVECLTEEYPKTPFVYYVKPYNTSIIKNMPIIEKRKLIKCFC